jgi:hypothetical protein
MSKYGKPIWQYVLEAARDLESNTFSPIDIIRKVHEKNPKIPSVTIRSYVIAMAPNHPSSIHYRSTRKLHGYFKYLKNGRFQLSPEMKGKTGIEEETSDEAEIEEELEEAAISLERDLETFIFENIASVENGLTPYEGKAGRQYSVESGRVDILAKDKQGKFVAIEIKAGTATDSVLTQVLSYMANIKKDLAKQTEIRGIIIAHDFPNRIISAISLLPNVKIMKYKARFDFETVPFQT